MNINQAEARRLLFHLVYARNLYDMGSVGAPPPPPFETADQETPCVRFQTVGGKHMIDGVNYDRKQVLSLYDTGRFDDAVAQLYRGIDEQEE